MTIIFRYITAITWFVQFKDIEMKEQMSTERHLFADIPMIFSLDRWERKSLASWSELIKKRSFPGRFLSNIVRLPNHQSEREKHRTDWFTEMTGVINLENIKSIWSLCRDEREAFQGIMARLDRYHHLVLIEEEMLLRCGEKESVSFSSDRRIAKRFLGKDTEACRAIKDSITILSGRFNHLH